MSKKKEVEVEAEEKISEVEMPVENTEVEAENSDNKSTEEPVDDANNNEVDQPDLAPEQTVTPAVKTTKKELINFYVEGYGNVKGYDYADAQKNAEAIKARIRRP